VQYDRERGILMGQPTPPAVPGTCYAHGIETCGACMAALSAELTAVTDRYHRLLTGQSRHDRDTTAAARAAAMSAVMAFGDQWAIRHIYQAETALRALIYQARQLASEAGRTVAARAQIDRLHMAAAAAEQWLGDHQPGDTFNNEPARAEANRLREFITLAARRLHATLSTGELPCRCDGCEMMRAMDDVVAGGYSCCHHCPMPAGYLQPGPDGGPPARACVLHRGKDSVPLGPGELLWAAVEGDTAPGLPGRGECLAPAGER
jgi:hypothetical protein